jgi:hypothetical protein
MRERCVTSAILMTHLWPGTVRHHVYVFIDFLLPRRLPVHLKRWEIPSDSSEIQRIITYFKVIGWNVISNLCYLRTRFPVKLAMWPFVYLTCNSYFNFETDYSSVSWPFHVRYICSFILKQHRLLARSAIWWYQRQRVQERRNLIGPMLSSAKCVYNLDFFWRIISTTLLKRKTRVLCRGNYKTPRDNTLQIIMNKIFYHFLAYYICNLNTVIIF